MTIKELEAADPAYLTEISRIVQGEHWDPHHLLGIHPYFDGKKIIRLWRPEANEIFIEVEGKIHHARKVHAGGFFDLIVDESITYKDYRIYHQNGLLAHDPYSFTPLWGELDTHLFGKGVHYQLYEMMGAKEVVHQGVSGVRFTVWAPGAKRVSLVADFNFWNGRVNPLRSMGSSGGMELFVPGLQEGERYKFE